MVVGIFFDNVGCSYEVIICYSRCVVWCSVVVYVIVGRFMWWGIWVDLCCVVWNFEGCSIGVCVGWCLVVYLLVYMVVVVDV